MMKQIAAAFLVLLSVAALASDDLREAKAEGWLGERADGFLGLVEDPAPERIVELLQTVNAKRRTEYQKIAQANNLTLEQVQALAGKKAIERTEPGGWILTNGGWVQK